MLNLRQVEHDVLANGRVEGHHLDLLRRELYAGGKIDRKGVELLVELRKRVEQPTPDFEHFFYQAVKDHLLAGGRIDAERAVWLRSVIATGDWIKDEDRRLMHELKGEAQETSPEFESLFAEAMKRPQDRHSSK
jgi:hypothetical protein